MIVIENEPSKYVTLKKWSLIKKIKNHLMNGIIYFIIKATGDQTVNERELLLVIYIVIAIAVEKWATER